MGQYKKRIAHGYMCLYFVILLIVNKDVVF